MFYVSIKNGGGDWELIYEPLNPELAIHSPKVTLEVGKAGSFTFSITEKNEHYKDLTQLTTLVLVEWGDKRSKTEIFRGRVFQVSMNFTKMKTVTCEGILAYLVDSMQKAKKYNGKARALFRKIISAHNDLMSGYPEKKFTIGNITIDDADVVIPGKKEDDDAYYNDKYADAVIEAIDDEWLTSYDYINDVLISYLGGYLVARNVNGTNYIDYLKDEAEESTTNTDAMTKIEYGVNLLDFTEEMDPEDLCTVVIPLGDSEDDKVLTIESATNKTEDSTVEVVKIGGKSIGIAHKAAVNKYGWIVKTHSFSNVNKANTLFTDGRKWLKSNRNIPTRYTIKAVDLQFIDPDSSSSIIKIGEMIRMVSAPHKMDATLMCTKIEYDIENPANNAYTLGNPEQSLTERYKKDKDKEDKKSRSRSRKSAGAAGKTAGEEAEAVAEDLDVTTTDLEKKIAGIEYVRTDDEGYLTLQAWYNKHEDGFQRVGVTFDAGQGSVDVFATWNEVTDPEHGNVNLKLLCDKNESAIIANADHITETTSAVANLTLRTTALEAMFKLFAEFESQTSVGQAGIEAKVDADHSEMKLFTDWKDKADDRISSAASIAMHADSYGSVIDLLAEHQGKLSSSLADLNIWANTVESKIALITEFQTTTADTAASITTKSDANGAYIDMLTDWKNKADDRISSAASIAMHADSYGAAIDLLASHQGYLSDSLAQLNIWANAIESKIALITEFHTAAADTAASITAKSDANGAYIDMLTNWKDKIEGSLNESMADIKMKADANEAAIEQLAQFNTNTSESLAQLNLRANALESVIEQIAKFTTTAATTTASITTKADANGALIDMLTDWKNTADGQLKGLAETKQWVDKNGAGIEQTTKWFEDNGNLTGLTKILQWSDDKISKIEEATKFYTENSEALTNISQWSNEDSAGIKSAAEFVNKTGENAGTRTLAGTITKANTSSAVWEAFATWETDSGTVKEGSIKIKATEKGTLIKSIATEIQAEAEKYFINTKEYKLVADKAELLGAMTLKQSIITVHNTTTFQNKVTCSKALDVQGSFHAGSIYVGFKDTSSGTNPAKVATQDDLKNYLKDSDINQAYLESKLKGKKSSMAIYLKGQIYGTDYETKDTPSILVTKLSGKTLDLGGLKIDGK